MKTQFYYLPGITFFLLLNFRCLSSTEKPISHQAKVSFIENKGQIYDQYFKTRKDILFAGNSGALNYFLSKNSISYQIIKKEGSETQNKLVQDPVQAYTHSSGDLSKIQSYRLDVSWLNVNPSSEIIAKDRLPGYMNFYLASCPEGVLNVSRYSSIIYENIYAGIDLVWHQSNGNLKYSYVVNAYSDYKAIRSRIEGASSILVNTKGELVICTPFGNIIEQKPLVKQDGKIIDAAWLVKDNIVSYTLRNFDPSRDLIIDPMIRLWGTYFGGSAEDFISSTTVDANSDILVSGGTESLANMATTGAHQVSLGGSGSTYGDAFLSKFSSTGALLWSTYYGGSDNDYANDCSSDNAGNIYLVGASSSSNTSVIATSGAHQTTVSSQSSNTSDAFLVKFDASGGRLWGTYFGGDNTEYPSNLSIDASGNIYFTGQTTSSNNISTPGAFQANINGTVDCFLVKFSSSGSRLWGSYFGGGGASESGFGCQTDITGNVYICGYTKSGSNISTSGCYQPTYSGGGLYGDAFLASFSSAGNLLWATYYGAANDDIFWSLKIDSNGNLFCVGFTSSTNSALMTTSNAFQSTYGGGNMDALVVKFSSSGARQYATYYGGSGEDYGTSLTFDSSGNFSFCGYTSTSSGTSIATPCTYQPLYGGGSHDVFLSKFSSSGNRLWGTYYGGSFTDNLPTCCFDNTGHIYMSGTTLANSGTVIASNNGFQPAFGGGTADGFLVKFDGCIQLHPVNSTPISQLQVCYGDSTILNTAFCSSWYADSISTIPLMLGSTLTTGSLTSDTTFFIENTSCGAVPPRTAIHVSLMPQPNITIIPSNTAMCIGETNTLTANGALTYTWASNGSTLSYMDLWGIIPTTYSVYGTNSWGCTDTASIYIDPSICLGLEETHHSDIVRIYPNPVHEILHIESNYAFDVLVTDINGKIHKQKKLNDKYINISGLSPGIYFLQLKRVGDIVYKTKIVKE